MWVTGSVLGHHSGLKMFFFLIASLTSLSNQRLSPSSTHIWVSSKACQTFFLGVGVLSRGSGMSVLGHLFMEGLFSMTNV